MPDTEQFIPVAIRFGDGLAAGQLSGESSRHRQIQRENNNYGYLY